MGFLNVLITKAAFLLFDTLQAVAEQTWHGGHGRPINFGENDNFWGLLVEGFIPALACLTTIPIMKSFFRNGFTIYFEQVTNHLNLLRLFPNAFGKLPNGSGKNRATAGSILRLKHKDKYLNDIKKYDDAWQHHNNFTPLNLETIKSEFEQAKPFLAEEFVYGSFTMTKSLLPFW